MKSARQVERFLAWPTSSLAGFLRDIGLISTFCLVAGIANLIVFATSKQFDYLNLGLGILCFVSALL